jgi:hypothetical protein
MVEVWKKTFKTHDAVPLTADDTDYSSGVLNCIAARKFLIQYRITKTGTLVDGDRLIIKVEFADEEDARAGNWHIYQNGPFGYLAEEESTTPCNKSVSGDCVGEYMRITVRTDYANTNPAVNYFTVTVKVTLMK